MHGALHSTWSWDYIRFHGFCGFLSRQDHLEDKTAVSNHRACFMRFANHPWFAFLKKNGVTPSTVWFNHQGVETTVANSFKCFLNGPLNPLAKHFKVT